LGVDAVDFVEIVNFFGGGGEVVPVDAAFCIGVEHLRVPLF